MAAASSYYEQPAEEFVNDQGILPYFLTPAFVISLSTALLSPYYVSPLFWRIVLPANIKRPPRSNMHFHTMLSSTLHAVVSSTLCIYILWYGLMGTSRIFTRLPLGFTTMQISLGYFVGDFIVCLLDPKLRSDKVSMMHHMAGMVGISLSLSQEGNGMFFVILLLTTEGSTPFVNFWSVLYHLGEKDKLLYTFTGMIMVITFILFRIVVIPWHWYEIWTTVMSEECAMTIPLFFRVWLGFNYLTFDIFNVIWCEKMISGALKHLRTKMKSS